MRTVFAFVPLLLSVFFMQLGVGVLGPLDALSAVELGFSARAVGLLGSAHFLGFVVGCVAAPGLLARAGHARAFSVAAAAGVIGALLHPVVQEAWAWMLFRVSAGFAIAVGYTVVESWLHARLDNANRGRALSWYRVIDMSGAVGSQLLLIQLEPAVYISYTIVAIIAVVSLLPLSLTTATPPEAPKRPRLRPMRAYRLSPLGVVGVFVVGVTNSSFRMVGPLYGVRFDMSREEIAYFLAAAMLGGALAQPGIGWLADRFDRRHILIGVSAAALIVCAALAAGLFQSLAGGATGAILGAFLFGAAAMPLYSISAAHANDRCPKDSIVEMNASLILFFALGAVFAPVVAAELVNLAGADALWSFIALAHIFLIVFGLLRLRRAAPPTERASYRYAPRSSLLLGRLLRNGETVGSRRPAPSEKNVSNESDLDYDEPRHEDRRATK